MLLSSVNGKRCWVKSSLGPCYSKCVLGPAAQALPRSSLEKLFSCPGRCSSARASSCTGKSLGFNSQSWHMPRFGVQSRVGATTNPCSFPSSPPRFSPPFLCPPLASKINKKYFSGENFKKRKKKFRFRPHSDLLNQNPNFNNFPGDLYGLFIKIRSASCVLFCFFSC